MIKKQLCFESRSHITNLKTTSPSQFAFFTKHHGLAIFDIEKSQIVKKLHKDYPNIKKTAISKNGKLLAIYFKNNIHVIDINSSKEIKILSVKDDILAMNFDEDSRYLITTDKEKNLTIYKYDKSTPLINFKTKTHVTNISFFKDELILSYKNVYETNLYTLTDFIQTEQTNYQIVKTIKTKEYLIVGDKKGNLYINNTKLSTPFTKLHDLLLVGNYLLVSGDANYITLIDVKNKKLLRSNYIDFDDDVFKMVLLANKTVILTLTNKQVMKVILSDEKELNSLILHNSLDKAYRLLEQDPMLCGTKTHKQLEDRYNYLYNQAINSLQNQNKKQAEQILKPLNNIASKKQELEFVFKAFEHFAKFQKLILTKEYSLAYNLATKYKPLQQTKPYKKLDEIFKQTFINAQRQMLLNKKENAKALLNEYMNAISKREIIKLILNQSEEFVKFVTATQKDDYETIKKLLHVNPVFKQIPTYIDIQTQMQNDIKKIQTATYELDIYKIKTILSNIKNKLTKTQLKSFNQIIKDITTLKTAYENSNFLKCYNIIDSHPSLQNTQLTNLLEKHWKKLMINCEDKAFKGDIKSIKESLQELINIRKTKVESLLKLSFYIKIKMLFKQREPKKIELLIYSYIDIFKEDEEIKKFIYSFEKNFNKKVAITMQPK